MLYRQMLPDPSFTQAILAYGSERQQMGPYYRGDGST